MLTKNKIENFAIKYLLQHNVPIIPNTCRVVLPDDEKKVESATFLREENLARVSFRSKYYDDPNDEHPCDPGVYIVYVDLNTGEVHMPLHM